MPLKVLTFNESTNPSRSQEVIIPNLTNVRSVTVNTGSVSHTVSGNKVTVSVSGGSPSRSEGGSYTPSKSVSQTDYSSYSGNLGSSIFYNDGTYSGTIYRTGGPYVYSGSAGYTDSKSASSSTTITVTDNYYWNGNSYSFQGTGYSQNSMSYSDGQGYSGTLYLQSYYGPTPNYPARPAAGTAPFNTSRSASGGASFSGTVTKTFPDTRTYAADYAGTVYGSTQYYSTNYYAYTVTIDYIDRVLLGSVFMQDGKGNKLSIPVYDADIGMTGINQLRTPYKGKMGCFELVPVTDSKASPFRVSTPQGIRAIAKAA